MPARFPDRVPFKQRGALPLRPDVLDPPWEGSFDVRAAGCKKLSERTVFEICEVRYWEDDGQDDGDADECRGGPNGALCLREARVNDLQFGACEASMVGNVRAPRPKELPEPRQAEPKAAPDRGSPSVTSRFEDANGGSDG
jgi:hypothetical protein